MRIKKFSMRKVVCERSPGGFTLIETFVAILILMTALAGSLTLASNGFNSSDIAGDQITATYLAQDAAEYVRWVRDTACFNTSGSSCGGVWIENLSACEKSAGNVGCYLDSLQPASVGVNPQQCDTSCPAMNFDDKSGFYNYNNPPSGYTQILNVPVETSGGLNPLSKFTRIVTIRTPTPNEADVTVEVSWLRPNGTSEYVTTREDLFNWEP